MALLLLGASAVFAAHHTAEERGKTLFNDSTLGSGTSGMHCGTCHPDGKGLEGVAGKSTWKTPVGSFTSLEAAINSCVTAALKGKELDPKSREMQDVVSYIKTLGSKDPPVRKKKPPIGC